MRYDEKTLKISYPPERMVWNFLDFPSRDDKDAGMEERAKLRKSIKDVSFVDEYKLKWEMYKKRNEIE